MCAFVPLTVFSSPARLKDFLCVSVCLHALKYDVSLWNSVFSERNLCYLLWTRLIMEHWNQSPSGAGEWRAPPASNDYTPLPSGPNEPLLTRGRNAIDPDSPKKIIKSIHFDPFSAMTLFQSFEAFSWKKIGPQSSEKRIRPLAQATPPRMLERKKHGSPLSLLFNVRPSLWEEFIFLHFHKHGGTSCIISRLSAGETQFTAVWGNFQLKLQRCSNNTLLTGLGRHRDAEAQTHINMPKSHKCCYIYGFFGEPQT